MGTEIKIQERCQDAMEHFMRDDVVEYSIVLKKKVVGELMIHVVNMSNTKRLNLFRVKVAEEHRGHKYGLAGIRVLQDLFENCEHIWLVCKPSLCDYYAQVGFVKTTRRGIPGGFGDLKITKDLGKLMIWKPEKNK